MFKVQLEFKYKICPNGKFRYNLEATFCYCAQRLIYRFLAKLLLVMKQWIRNCSVSSVCSRLRKCPWIRGNCSVCINIFARLNASATLIGCHSADTPGRQPFSRIWAATNAWPLNSTSAVPVPPLTYLNHNQSSALVDVRASHPAPHSIESYPVHR